MVGCAMCFYFLGLMHGYGGSGWRALLVAIIAAAVWPLALVALIWCNWYEDLVRRGEAQSP